MISLKQIESDLVTAMKAKDQLSVGVLRGLKTRIQNEKAAKGRPEALTEGSIPGSKELTEEEILALVRSEIKKRKEAAAGFERGGNAESSQKELQEAEILGKFLPPQMSEEEIAKMAEEIIASGGFKAQDFGKAMGALKAKAGSNADGAVLAKILKEKLK
jgi:uncharacterized protein YqeY